MTIHKKYISYIHTDSYREDELIVCDKGIPYHFQKAFLAEPLTEKKNKYSTVTET